MTRLLAAAATASITAAAALTLAVSGPAAAAVPGPKEPIEHAGIGGAHFFKRSGTPGCFTGGGSVGAGFPVPAGARLVGATLYVIDSQPNRGDLRRARPAQLHQRWHLHPWARAPVPTAPERSRSASTRGTSSSPDEAVNLIVTIGDGTCFKGGEVHFVRSPSAPPPASRQSAPAPAPGLKPDGAPTD